MDKEKVELLKKAESTLEDQKYIKKLKNEDVDLLNRGVEELKREKRRSKETKKFIIFSGIIILIMIAFAGSYILSQKEKTIIGEVINTEFHDEYMTVTFDNGESYNINYYGVGFEHIDLTVNSKMRIELSYSSPFFYPNVNNVWYVNNIVKVPDVGDE